VEYLDSTGVRLLFRLARALASSGGSLRAVVPQAARIRRVLDLAGASQAVPFHETEQDAVSGLLEGGP
jgi:anti-anti-sigma factor